jgi:hypothetical protein
LLVVVVVVVVVVAAAASVYDFLRSNTMFEHFFVQTWSKTRSNRLKISVRTL